MKKILFILAFLISTVAISQTVSTSMKATNLLIVNTDYTITNTTVRTFHVYAPRAYPTIQSLTVTYKSATGLTNVATKLYGKITELGDSTQISSTNNWNCTADPAEIVNVINTTANLYQYYTISIVGTGTGTAVIDKIELQLWNATYPNAVARLTGTGGMTITGETVNLNASSNYATNINTGTSNGAVTIGGNSGTVAVNSSDWDISTTGAMTGIGAITADGLITGTAGATISGATTNINASSNFITNIGTGTTTGAINLGGGSNTVAVNSTTWDITSAGVFTGMLRKVLTDATGTKALAATDANIVLFCTAAGGATTVTIPDPSAATVGVIYYIIQTADQNLIVTATTANNNSIVCDGVATSDNVTISTTSHKIGAGMIVIGISATQWYVGGLNPESLLTPEAAD